MTATQPERKHDADSRAEEAHNDCLGQELLPDVGLMRADRDANADLSRAFGHRHQHDVHDADAADDERYAANRREQKTHGLREGLGRFYDQVRVGDNEVLASMPPFQQFDNLQLRQALGLIFAKPHFDPVQIIPSGQTRVGCGVGDQNIESLGSRHLQHRISPDHADDDAGQLPDINDLAEWINSIKKLPSDLFVNHHNLSLSKNRFPVEADPTLEGEIPWIEIILGDAVNGNLGAAVVKPRQSLTYRMGKSATNIMLLAQGLYVFDLQIFAASGEDVAEFSTRGICLANSP